MLVKLLFALLLASGLFLTFGTAVFADSALDRLTVNHETKQCGVYFPGDEHIRYDPPSGWTDYGGITYSQEGEYIETDMGFCRDGDYDSKSIFVNCCKQIGYEYVEDPYNPDISTQTGESKNFFTVISRFFRSIFN